MKLRACAGVSHPACRLDAMSRYRFPPGVKFLGKSGNEFTLAVTMPDDDEGFFGRECPSCQGHFRVASDDYEDLPDEQMLWCVYCGHHDHNDEFVTAQQMARLEQAATTYAEQMVNEMLDETFGKMSRRSHGSRDSFIQISWDVEPFRPTPLPGINEERLIRERACPDCALRYAVFAEHRYCPVCGQLPALDTALDSLYAEAKRLDALADIPEATHAQLRESGVLDRTYVDTIENAVGIVETLAERAFKSHVAEADQILRGRGQVFQRLNDLADLYGTYLRIELPRLSRDGLASAAAVLGSPPRLHALRRHHRRQIPGSRPRQPAAAWAAPDRHRSHSPRRPARRRVAMPCPQPNPRPADSRRSGPLGRLPGGKPQLRSRKCRCRELIPTSPPSPIVTISLWL